MLMSELASEAGGVARVESAPGWGTKVVVEVPST
jgi:signal transduction histidine kinase